MFSTTFLFNYNLICHSRYPGENVVGFEAIASRLKAIGVLLDEENQGVSPQGPAKPDAKGPVNTQSPQSSSVEKK